MRTVGPLFALTFFSSTLASLLPMRDDGLIASHAFLPEVHDLVSRSLTNPLSFSISANTTLEVLATSQATSLQKVVVQFSDNSAVIFQGTGNRAMAVFDLISNKPTSIVAYERLPQIVAYTISIFISYSVDGGISFNSSTVLTQSGTPNDITVTGADTSDNSNESFVTILLR
ncbi:hypothetical protein BDQ12DRAFT_477762 [Crucibulum laeve]|uniref:Secreted protein n=1 Tax=Crucibulum laeve TaxID=68775 RepID=A0A5C3LIQ8_9AGAR|nr:hypothetical protein BDQ12DRAFT_477762 [Crucibulum laeve]